MCRNHIFPTDILIEVVRKMREEILRLGGEFSFHSQVTDLLVEQHCLQVNRTEEIPAGVAVLQSDTVREIRLRC